MSKPTSVLWFGHQPDGWANYGLAECGSTSPFGPVVTTPSSPDCGAVFRYRPGTFSAAKVTRGAPVTVDGHPGYYLKLAYLVDPINEPTPVPTIAWQYDSGHWAVVQALTKATPAIALSLARANAVQIEDPSNNPQSAKVAPGAPVPVTFGYRPAALTTLAVKPAGDSSTSKLFVVRYTSADKATTLTTELYGPDAKTGTPPPVPAQHTDLTIGGHTVHVGAHSIDAVIGDYAIHISYAGPEALPSDTLKIAKAMSFPANLNDTKTWFDGDDMVP